jgi:hypothetical protein
MSVHKPSPPHKSICYRQLARNRFVQAHTSHSANYDNASQQSNSQPVRIQSHNENDEDDHDDNNKPAKTVPRLDLNADDESDLAAEKEVTSGQLVKYNVVVKTGDRLGSSSEAEIHVQLYGARGKSKIVTLLNSSTHRVPFRRSNVDNFELELYDVGPIRAVKVGHNEKDIGSYAHFTL